MPAVPDLEIVSGWNSDPTRARSYEELLLRLPRRGKFVVFSRGFQPTRSSRLSPLLLCSVLARGHKTGKADWRRTPVLHRLTALSSEGLGPLGLPKAIPSFDLIYFLLIIIIIIVSLFTFYLFLCLL